MMHQALERVDSVQEQWPERAQVRRRLTSQPNNSAHQTAAGFGYAARRCFPSSSCRGRREMTSIEVLAKFRTGSCKPRAAPDATPAWLNQHSGSVHQSCARFLQLPCFEVADGGGCNAF